MKNEITNNKTMTVQEVAGALNVSDRYVRKTISEVRNNSAEVFGDVNYNSQGGILLNEKQVTLIKMNLQNKTKVNQEAPKTQLEKQLLVMQAMQILQEEVNDLKQRAEEAERRNAILMHTSKLYTVTEIAKELGLNSANELNKILEEKGIQYKVNGTWVPTTRYSSLGYFEIKQEVHDNGYVYYDRKVTQDGRAFILELLA